MRVAIVADKSLTAGQVANCAAVLCGQLGTLNYGFFGIAPVTDASGHKHSAVKHNIVVLKANSEGQILRTATETQEAPDLEVLFFSKEGQMLSNDFPAYAELLSARRLEELKPAGVLIAGPDAKVRAATKRFSLWA